MADERNIRQTLRARPQAFFRKIQARYLDRYPSKQYINLWAVSEPRINWVLTVPLILLVLVATGAAAKFGVWDRMELANREEARLAALRAELAEQYAVLERYDIVEERYSHYTYSGMTKAERERTDRLEVMELLRRIVLPRTTLDSWTVSENTVTLYIRALTLEDVNLL
ncbi:MAG: hypothetical protein IJ705_07245, partial [Oscillospiraceae bacterium]|nr:hypothetical protein [Oscillospiraceae bacterium]